MNKTLLLGVVSIMLIGCGNNTMRSLEQLETRIDHVPDSVLSVLNSMESGFLTGEPRALYALLTVRAQDKCDLLTGNDSLITIATNYYGKRGNLERRLFAHIYAGRVYSATGNSQKAIELYTEALKYEDQTDNYYALGLLYSDIATEYSWAYDYVQAIEYIDKALLYYERTQKERHKVLAKASLGLYHLNNHNHQKAEHYLKEVLAWGELNSDKYIITIALSRLCSIYDETSNYLQLSKLYANYPLEMLEQNSRNYGIASYYYTQQNESEKANELLEKAWELAVSSADTTFLWHREYMINNHLSDYKSALINFQNLFYYQDSVLRITLQQPLIKVQRDYYKSELDVAKLKNRNRLLTILLVLFSVFIFLFIIWHIYKERIRVKENSIKELIESLNELRYKLSVKDEELCETVTALESQRSNTDVMERKISELFHKQYRLLNTMCATYYENPMNKNMNKLIFDQFETVMKSFSEDGYYELEQLVNKYQNNVIHLLRTEFSVFKESDFRLMCYSCAGFSNKTISLILGTKPNALRSFKSRIITRIKNSSQPSRDLILSEILRNAKLE